jgi:hypothetical protein
MPATQCLAQLRYLWALNPVVVRQTHFCFAASAPLLRVAWARNWQEPSRAGAGQVPNRRGQAVQRVAGRATECRRAGARRAQLG